MTIKDAWQATAFAVAITAGVVFLCFWPWIFFGSPTKPDEYQAFISKRKLDEWLWEGYVNCEFNVRYRDHAGDDGFRSRWAALRDKHASYYHGDTPLTDDIVDALYEERVKISHAEPAQTNMPSIRAAWDELEADIEAKRWPSLTTP